MAGLEHRLAPLAVLILALLSFGIGLADLPVQDRDEARFAQAARQMAETGDLIDIRLLDQPRHNKPALIYWLQTAALWITGSDGVTPIWVHRLPSYLAGGLSSLALIWAGTPLIGRRGAVLAGLMCATLYMLHAEARTAKTDAALLLSVILAMGALARIWMDAERGWANPAILWTALAAGFLLKGPMVALPVAGAALWGCLRDRSARWLGAARPLPGLLWFALLSGPWFLAITIVTEGAFWQASLGADLTDKITADGEHGARPPGLYLLTLWLTFWPWTLLVPLALGFAWARRQTREVAFLLGWLIPGWLVFEAVPVKLIHYTLPLYPALLLLAAAALVDLFEGKGRFGGIGGVVGSIGFLLCAAPFAGIMVLLPSFYGSGADLASIVGAGLLVLGSGAALWAFWSGRAVLGTAALAAAGIVMGWTMTTATLPAAREFWIAERLVSATAQHACLARPLALPGFREPSGAFHFGGEVTYPNDADVLDYLAGAENRAAWRRARPEEDGVEGLTRITGINPANFRPVDLRLWVSPGIPAPEAPCG